jgi:hypothetical protein
VEDPVNPVMLLDQAEADYGGDPLGLRSPSLEGRVPAPGSPMSSTPYRRSIDDDIRTSINNDTEDEVAGVEPSTDQHEGVATLLITTSRDDVLSSRADTHPTEIRAIGGHSRCKPQCVLKDSRELEQDMAAYCRENWNLVSRT